MAKKGSKQIILLPRAVKCPRSEMLCVFVHKIVSIVFRYILKIPVKNAVFTGDKY